MKGNLYDYNGGIYIDKTQERLGLHKNDNYKQLISEIEVVDKKVLVIYQFHLIDQGQYIYMTPGGPINLAKFSEKLYRKYEIQWGLGEIGDEKWAAITRALGWAQFEAVKQFIFDFFERAIVRNITKYNGLVESVTEIQKEQLNEPNLEQKYGSNVSDLEGFKVKDVLLVPQIEPIDFVPDTFVFGPMRWAWGAANWKAVGSEKIAFYDIIGAAFDYIRGEPLILAHEFTHTNPYLQGSPTTLYFDFEMWTALTNDLADDLMWFSHPYLAVPRDTVHTYFGYDTREAYNRIWPERFVSLRDFNRKEYEKNTLRVQEIREALEEFVIEVFFPNFYSDPYFWNSVNLKWCDTAAAWRIMLAFRFEPAIIFDEKKLDPKTGEPVPASVQTKQWLAEQSSKIRDLADEAMKEAGQITEIGEHFSKLDDYNDFIKCPADSSWADVPIEQQKKLIEMIKTMIDNEDPSFIRALWHINRIRNQ
jgi:hypothetical protein